MLLNVKRTVLGIRTGQSWVWGKLWTLFSQQQGMGVTKTLCMMLHIAHWMTISIEMFSLMQNLVHQHCFQQRRKRACWIPLIVIVQKLAMPRQYMDIVTQWGLTVYHLEQFNLSHLYKHAVLILLTTSKYSTLSLILDLITSYSYRQNNSCMA